MAETTRTLLAWHGDPTIKEAVLKILREHRRLDQIVQGQHWDEGRGYHLVCLTHADEDSKPHAQVERLFGIEERVGFWLEAVFEGLPQRECAAWVIDSCEAIPVGADLSLCHHELAAWLLTESGLLTINEVNRDAIEDCAALHRRAAAGEPIDDDSWQAAAEAARSARLALLTARSSSAAVWSAGSAAEAWSAQSAMSAAWSVRSAAAAWSVRSAAAAWSAASAAESTAWRAIANRSLEIFRNAPIPAAQD